jgi:hypothetical protein
MVEQEVPDILTQANKEKFRRRMVIASKGIGILLVLAIFWIGWIQIAYMKEVNQLKAEYGPKAYCYLCGKENFKRCDCQYFYNAGQDINRSAIAEELALYNAMTCNVTKQITDTSFNSLNKKSPSFREEMNCSYIF